MPYGQHIDIDLAIAAVAAKQHGIITRGQLLGLGLGRAAIAYRCRAGRLFRVHLGVYAVGRPPRTPLERASASVLACGAGAVLSHFSALTLWGLTPRWTRPFHVTCPSRRRRPLIITHISPGLTRADVRAQLDIRATSPARTLLDCAPLLPSNRLARIAADARRNGLVHPGQLADVLARFPHHAGRSKLLQTLDGLGSPTRSELEDVFLLLCDTYGLPTPKMNARFAGYEVDALFEAQRVIVELDGWEFHRDRYSFEGDRERDANTLLHGAVTIRITWQRMTATPRQEAERLAAILRSRPLLG